jgi:hypothetical protein
MKKRIVEITFFTAPYCYIVQYRMFGVWMTYSKNDKGVFFKINGKFFNDFYKAKKFLNKQERKSLRIEEWGKHDFNTEVIKNNKID